MLALVTDGPGQRYLSYVTLMTFDLLTSTSWCFVELSFWTWGRARMRQTGQTRTAQYIRQDAIAIVAFQKQGLSRDNVSGACFRLARERLGKQTGRRAPDCSDRSG